MIHPASPRTVSSAWFSLDPARAYLSRVMWEGLRITQLSAVSCATLLCYTVAQGVLLHYLFKTYLRPAAIVSFTLFTTRFVIAISEEYYLPSPVLLAAKEKVAKVERKFLNLNTIFLVFNTVLYCVLPKCSVVLCLTQGVYLGIKAALPPNWREEPDKKPPPPTISGEEKFHSM